MSLTTRNGAETSDQLKYLSERIPATFVYAGLDMDSTGLFNGTRGKQIASRFAVLESDAFPYGTPRQREDWHALVATLEQSLRLHRHTPPPTSPCSDPFRSHRRPGRTRRRAHPRATI